MRTYTYLLTCTAILTEWYTLLLYYFTENIYVCICVPMRTCTYLLTTGTKLSTNYTVFLCVHVRTY